MPSSIALATRRIIVCRDTFNFSAVPRALQPVSL